MGNAQQDHQGEAVVIRHVGAGHTVGDARACGQHGHTHLIFDIAIGRRGKGGRLFVMHANGPDTTVRCKAHNILDRAPCETKEDFNALTLDGLSDQCTPFNLRHLTPPQCCALPLPRQFGERGMLLLQALVC